MRRRPVPFAAAALLSLQVAFEPPEVRAAGVCPSAADVAARLGPLLPAASHDGAANPDVVELAERPAELHVRLRDPDGSVSHDRVLVAGPSCGERAAAAAAIIAAWEADLHADVAFPTSPEPPVAPAPEPARPPEVPAEPPPIIVTAPGAGGRYEATAVPPVATVGVELFAAAPGGGGPVPAGSAEVTRSLTDRIHGRASMLATGIHALTLGPGQVTWRRVGLGLGAIVDLTRGRLWTRGRADVSVAAVFAQGRGFSINQNATSWQIGLDLGGRVGVNLTPRISLWADVGMADFPGAQRFSVENAGSAPPVPGLEVQAGLGLSFLLSR